MLNQLTTLIKRSPPAALLILLLLIMVFGLLGAMQLQGLSQMMSLELKSVIDSFADENTLQKRNFLRWAAIINQVSTFLLPALVFAYFAQQHAWFSFLKLHKNPHFRNILLGTLMLLFFMPIAQYAFYLNKQLPLPEWAVSMEDGVNNLISGLLQMDSTTELLFNLVTIALVPALAEEFLFRGVIQQKLAEYSRRPELSIWIAAIVFSAMHGQFEGFFARMLLGASLGYLLFWTQNLWVPIIAHFVHNGVQVLAAYAYKEEIAALSPENSEPVSVWIVGLCLIFVIGIGWLMRNSSQERA